MTRKSDRWDPVVALRMPAAEIARVKAAAAAKGYSFSEFVRLLVLRGMAFAGDLAPKVGKPKRQPAERDAA